jgi:hypothetical protein
MKMEIIYENAFYDSFRSVYVSVYSYSFALAPSSQIYRVPPSHKPRPTCPSVPSRAKSLGLSCPSVLPLATSLGLPVPQCLVLPLASYPTPQSILTTPSLTLSLSSASHLLLTYRGCGTIVAAWRRKKN